jgi:hypothetical protein
MKPNRHAIPLRHPRLHLHGISFQVMIRSIRILRPALIGGSSGWVGDAYSARVSNWDGVDRRLLREVKFTGDLSGIQDWLESLDRAGWVMVSGGQNGEEGRTFVVGPRSGATDLPDPPA